jgi:hypothetical protein
MKIGVLSVQLDRDALTNRYHEVQVHIASNDTWCRHDNCGCFIVIGHCAWAIASSSIGNDFTPGVDYQRVSVTLPFGIVMSKLSRGNDVALAFDCPSCIYKHANKREAISKSTCK